MNCLTQNQTENFLLHIRIIRRMTFELEYLGKLKFMFKNILGRESGGHYIGSINEKKRQKISCKCTSRIFVSKRFYIQYSECWPCPDSDISVNGYGGVHSLPLCSRCTLGLLPATRPASTENTSCAKYQIPSSLARQMACWIITLCIKPLGFLCSSTTVQ